MIKPENAVEKARDAGFTDSNAIDYIASLAESGKINQFSQIEDLWKETKKRMDQETGIRQALLSKGDAEHERYRTATLSEYLFLRHAYENPQPEPEKKAAVIEVKKDTKEEVKE